ncbi:MAG: sulfatase-like hydrolase/transferase, partial [Planctomycetota bacterium]
ANRDRPFLLYYATPVPHAAIQVPDDSLAPYAGRLDEDPYLGQKGYLPHPEPRAGYAAMVSRMDRDVGRMLALLDELGLAEDTIVLFTSDNGPTFNGGTDSAFFRSAGPLRGLKTMLYEGGIRVPLVVRWPGRIEPGTVSDHVGAFWDILPTLAEITGFVAPSDVDGLSFAPTLLGEPSRQAEHEALYWEYRGGQAVRLGRWKGLRRRGQQRIELYDLELDVGETRDVADAHPQPVDRIAALMVELRSESEHFPLTARK